MNTPARIPCPGEIYYADLGEHAGRRRVIVASREDLNRGDYVLVVPVTSQRFSERARMQNCLPFGAGQYGFVADTVAQTELSSVIRKDVLDLHGGPVGTLDDGDLRALIKAIGYTLDADCEFRSA